jgi:hypothetical protein
MNEQQNPGATASGRREFGSSTALGIDRHDRTPPELPERVISRRDETVRAGEHHYRSRAFEMNENHERQNDNTLPIIGASFVGGVALAVLFAKLTQPNNREHNKVHEDRYSSSQPRWRASETFGTHMGASAHHSSENGSVATDETWSLIGSDKVEGTAVYDSQGEKLGSVYNFMVDKRSGHVAYAVMSFGGWLGMGESYHPLPWSALTYDTALGGYRVSVSKDRLRNAPSHQAGHDVSSDETYLRRLKDYWA